MRFPSGLCLAFLGSLAWPACIDFETPPAGFWEPRFTALETAKPISGKASMKIDSMAEGKGWNVAWRSEPITGGTYRVSFRYLITASAGDSQLTLSVRPVGSENATEEQVHCNFRNLYDDRPRETRNFFTLPKDPRGYQAILYVKNRVAVLLDDLCIDGDAKNEFIPPTGGFHAGEVKPAIPAGPAPFEIERPVLSPKMPVVRGADFGFDSGAEDNSGAFIRAIEAVRGRRGATLLLPKGVFRITNNATLAIEGLSHVNIEAVGTELLFCKERNELISVRSNDHLRIAGLTVDWDEAKSPIASDVFVQSVGPRGAHLDLRFQFPDPPLRTNLAFRTMEELDPVSGFPGVEGAMNPRAAEPLGKQWLDARTVRLTSSDGDVRDRFATLSPGRRFRIAHYRYEMTAFYLRDNAHLTLEGVTVYGAPGHGFLNSGDQHHWQLLGCKVTRRPGTRRVISVSGDHFHSEYSRGYLKLEGCDFSFGTDDCVNVHDNVVMAFPAGGRLLQTTNARLPFYPGDRVAVYDVDYRPLAWDGVVATVTPPKFRHNGAVQIEFDRELPASVPRALILANRRFSSANVIIRDCDFHDNNSKGVVLGAPDMLVEGNRFAHNKLTAVLVTLGFYFGRWSEGFAVTNLVIRGNRIEACHIDDSILGYSENASPFYFGAYLGDSVTPHLRPRDPVFRWILVESNEIIDCPGSPFFISSAADLTFKGNRIKQISPRKIEFPFRGMAVLDQCSNVLFRGNRFEPSPCAPKTGLSFDPATVRSLGVEGAE